MEKMMNIRKCGARGRKKKWLNLSCDHLIEAYSYGTLPGCLSYKKACARGHQGAGPREAKAEDGAKLECCRMEGRRSQLINAAEHARQLVGEQMRSERMRPHSTATALERLGSSQSP